MEPGRPLKPIGGIEGNEPGGFLSADLYTDMSQLKDNLGVVPRACCKEVSFSTRPETNNCSSALKGKSA
jgi:hypothetical protein